VDIFPARRRERAFPRMGGDADGIPVLPWPSFAEAPTPRPSRADIPATIARLRHLQASPEPALVFTDLAAVCVPVVCDGVVIDVIESDHRYRIRQPVAGVTLPAAIVSREPPDAHRPGGASVARVCLSGKGTCYRHSWLMPTGVIDPQ
jgi:hypothetical protein